MTTFHLREPLTLLDLIVVRCNTSDDELDQMRAFGTDETAEDWAARMWRIDGPKWAIAGDDERAVAVGGIARIRPGVGESWFLATQQAWTPRSNLTALVRGTKEKALRHGGWHRIETYCLASRTKAHSWYTFCLGLRLEATLDQFCTDGRDAMLFVATRENT